MNALKAASIGAEIAVVSPSPFPLTASPSPARRPGFLF